MRSLRLAAFALTLALPAVALAQQPPQQPPSAQQPPQQPTTQQPPAAQQPQEPPVGVIPIPAGELTPELVVAVRDAVVAGLEPHVEGRSVLPMTDEQRLIAILQCPDAACIGAQLADAGAIAGVLVRISRDRARAPVVVRLQVVDPVSGNPRSDEVEVEIPADELESAAERVGAVVGQLSGAMPAPPPKSTLLVAVNVDDATVSVDGEQVGTTPLAPVEVSSGRHVVDVSIAGFSDARSSIDVGRGEDARLNVVLEPSPDNVAVLEADAAPTGEEGAPAGPSEPWYTRWYVIAAGGAVVAAVLVGVIIAVASSGGDGQPKGIPIPPIE